MSARISAYSTSVCPRSPRGAPAPRIGNSITACTLASRQGCRWLALTVRQRQPASPIGERRASARLSALLAAGRIAEAVRDGAEDAVDVAAQEDHRGDDSDGDQGHNEGVLDQSLALLPAHRAQQLRQCLAKEPHVFLLFLLPGLGLSPPDGVCPLLLARPSSEGRPFYLSRFLKPLPSLGGVLPLEGLARASCLVGSSSRASPPSIRP